MTTMVYREHQQRVVTTSRGSYKGLVKYALEKECNATYEVMCMMLTTRSYMYDSLMSNMDGVLSELFPYTTDEKTVVSSYYDLATRIPCFRQSTCGDEVVATTLSVGDTDITLTISKDNSITFEHPVSLRSLYLHKSDRTLTNMYISRSLIELLLDWYGIPSYTTYTNNHIS